MYVDFFTGLKTTSEGKTYNYTNSILWENDEFSIEIQNGKLCYYINETQLGLAFESLLLWEGGLKIFLKLTGSHEKIGIMQGYLE